VRRILAALALVLTLAACTPAEAIQWWGVYQEHPQGAVRFARCVTHRPKAWHHPGAVRHECRRLGRQRQIEWNRAHAEVAALAGMQSCGQWAEEAWAAGWRSEGYDLGRVMYAESRCNADAWNPQPHFGGHASGLMQVIDPTWQGECGYSDIFDPVENLRCALYLRTHYGWSQWVTY
jgi:Transglycosylase SLT domain